MRHHCTTYAYRCTLPDTKQTEAIRMMRVAHVRVQVAVGCHCKGFTSCRGGSVRVRACFGLVVARNNVDYVQLRVSVFSVASRGARATMPVNNGRRARSAQSHAQWRRKCVAISAASLPFMYHAGGGMLWSACTLKRRQC